MTNRISTDAPRSATTIAAIHGTVAAVSRRPAGNDRDYTNCDKNYCYNYSSNATTVRGDPAKIGPKSTTNHNDNHSQYGVMLMTAQCL